jgi:ketosteroid isomerase-like protein
MASRNQETISTVFQLARHADHRTLRMHLHEDATWQPASTAKWRACSTADDVVRTLLWRAEANRLRPGEMIDLGDRVLVQLRGRRLERLGAKGFVPRLFQVIVLRGGKVASIRDYARREEALGAVGVAKQ